MHRFFLIILCLLISVAQAATIAIIDTGFDLDHDFLKPKILKQETDEEAVNPDLKTFSDWNFHDNSHLKKAVIDDPTSLQEILLYRNLRAKGHQEGLSLQEFEWFKKHSSDKVFMEKVKLFKKHSHGTFVAGIALREGENIQIFPIRGLNIPIPVVAVGSTPEATDTLLSKTPEEKFKEEIKNSIKRVQTKFSKICRYLSLNGIEIVNASYGITYKNIMSRFRDSYRGFTGREIDEPRLKEEVDKYFETLYRRSEKVIKKYPKMLFVFSAGNSGLDNDLYHHYPSRITLPNTITVAAMNGDYLANFSNYGVKNVDIGAPGVAILSLVPRVYSKEGVDLYSPSSGTSMSAPFISNLAAQILNINRKLSSADIKRIIMETGNEMPHLKTKLLSGATADNGKALKAALLSRDMGLNEAISLARSNLIPMEDKISMGQPPAISAESIKKNVMESVPQIISPSEIDEDPTSEESFSPKHQEKGQPDNSRPLPSASSAVPRKSSDQVPSNQNEGQSPTPSEVPPASSSPQRPILPEVQYPTSVPSSP
jgi:subtilisin family serine protease